MFNIIIADCIELAILYPFTCIEYQFKFTFYEIWAWLPKSPKFSSILGVSNSFVVELERRAISQIQTDWSSNAIYNFVIIVWWAYNLSNLSSYVFILIINMVSQVPSKLTNKLRTFDLVFVHKNKQTNILSYTFLFIEM